MAYSISEVITHAEAGDPILITAIAPNTDVLIEIGDRTIILSERHSTCVVTASNIAPKTEVISDIRSLDLGLYFTANDVLSSYSLRHSIADELIIADAGTTALSKAVVTT